MTSVRGALGALTCSVMMFGGVATMLINGMSVAHADDGTASELVAEGLNYLSSANSSLKTAYGDLHGTDATVGPDEDGDFATVVGGQQIPQSSEEAFMTALSTRLIPADETSPSVVGALTYLDDMLEYQASNDAAILTDVAKDQGISLAEDGVFGLVNNQGVISGEGAVNNALDVTAAASEISSIFGSFGF